MSIPAKTGAGIAADMLFGSGKANAPGPDGRVDTSIPLENKVGLVLGAGALGKLAIRQGAKLLGKSASNSNKFPENPNDLTKQLGTQPKVSSTPDGTIRMKWQPNQNTGIRFESHPHGLKPNDKGFNPRHHGEHYHIETKPGSMSWIKAGKSGGVLKAKPNGYTPGSGTGFIPGEKFPGVD